MQKWLPCPLRQVKFTNGQTFSIIFQNSWPINRGLACHSNYTKVMPRHAFSLLTWNLRNIVHFENSCNFENLWKPWRILVSNISYNQYLTCLKHKINTRKAKKQFSHFMSISLQNCHNFRIHGLAWSSWVLIIQTSSTNIIDMMQIINNKL